MKRAISLLLVIVMTTIALAGCDSKSENPAGNANSKQPTDESITIKDSPDKYTWYIKNYVGKNCASIGYTSMSGDRMDHYGAGYIELVMVTPDGAYIDIETDDNLKQYVVTAQSYAPDTEKAALARRILAKAAEFGVHVQSPTIRIWAEKP